VESTLNFPLRLIPLMPFLGAAVLILFGRKLSRDWVHVISSAAILAAAIVAFDGYFTRMPSEGGLSDVCWTWMQSGDLKIDLAFRMDALSGLLCLIITFIGFLIHVYAQGYMEHDADYARFFAYLNLFCGAMLVLVLGDSLPVMFVGWEGVGLCSYLLIGFWFKETANADAGKKAFITNRIGDFGFLLGMFLLFHVTGTLKFTEIGEVAGGSLKAALLAPYWLGAPVAFWIGLFLFVGATGKSAQIPLYVWLPDAMAGPTPVSALIHAATMVTAGVYMVARLHLLYLLSPGAMAIVACVGAATALFAAIIGFAQNDFKKVLAYSTVSQLGFMFAGVGTANFAGGVFHLYTHAFFKAGLFLCAGSVMHAMSGSGDITIMGGLRKKVPWTHGVFFVCWLAICGVPIFSGFFSKDAIVAGAFATEVYGEHLAWVGKAVGVALLLAALGTAFYMSRLYFLVFSGAETRANDEIKHHIHESPGSMVGPLVVLAIGAGLGGLVGLPGALFGHPEWNFLGHRLESVLGPELDVPHATEATFMAVSTVIALVGIGLAWAFYGGGYREPAKKFAEAFPGFVRLARDKFRVDELYAAVFVRPLRFASLAIYQFVDRWIIDGLVNAVGMVTSAVGSLARRFQNGDGQGYMAWFAIGVAALVYWSTRPVISSELRITRTGLSVEVDAHRGGRASQQPLEYEFDFDDDGKPEVTGVSSVAHHTYGRPGSYKLRITASNPGWGTKNTNVYRVEVQ
jgi:NADH-quinone oxidoreductase subunit L